MEWADVLEQLTAECPPLAGALLGSSAIRKGDKIIIVTGNPLFKVLIKEESNTAVLRRIVESKTGGTVRFAARSPQTAVAAEAPADPLSAFLQQARDAGVTVTE